MRQNETKYKMDEEDTGKNHIRLSFCSGTHGHTVYLTFVRLVRSERSKRDVIKKEKARRGEEEGQSRREREEKKRK